MKKIISRIIIVLFMILTLQSLLNINSKIFAASTYKTIAGKVGKLKLKAVNDSIENPEDYIIIDPDKLNITFKLRKTKGKYDYNKYEQGFVKIEAKEVKGYIITMQSAFSKDESVIKIKEGYTQICPIKPGNTTVEIGIMYQESGMGMTEARPDSYIININVIDEEEEEKEKKRLEDIEKKRQEAYNTIPDINADANTIQTFLGSDAKNNAGKNLKTVSKETARAWYKTLEKERLPEAYQKSMDLLNDYINDRDITKSLENIADQEKDIENDIKIKIKKIKATLDPGQTRMDYGYFDDALEDIDNYKPGDISDEDASVVESKTGKILAIITNIAMVVAVIVPAVLGVKYMLGSVEERADYKKDMIPYLVGAVLIFGISLVVKIVQQFGNTINSL